ncbi:MAG: HIT domain-containing protein [Actinomycetota bacterium]
MDTTVFGRILAGEAEVSWIAREHGVAAFMDLHPINPGHALVISERPAVGLADLDPEDGRQMFAMAQRVAAAIRASDIRCDGINLVLADGVVAGQEVFHVHLHVIPRLDGDAFGFQHAPGYPRAEVRATLDEHAMEIKRSLGQA